MAETFENTVLKKAAAEAAKIGTQIGTEIGEAGGRAIGEALSTPENQADIHSIAKMQLAQAAKEKAKLPPEGSRFNATGQGGGISLDEVISGLSGDTYTSPDQARLDLKKAMRDFKANNPGETAETYIDAESAVQSYITGKLRARGDEGRHEESGRTQKLQSNFDTAMNVERAREEEKRLLKEAQDIATAKLASVSDNIGSALDDADSNPEDIEDITQSWANDFVKAATIAGVSQSEIEKSTEKGVKQILGAGIDALTREDPEGALEFISENADRLGSDVLKYKNKARAYKDRLDKAAAVSRKNRIKSDMPVELDKVRSLTSSKDGDVREAAIDRERDLVKDPIKAGIEAGYISEEVGDMREPAQWDQREVEWDGLRGAVGRHVKILTPGEVDRLEGLVNNPEGGRAVLDAMAALESGTKNTIADQLSNDPLGWALRVGNENKKLQDAILNGRAAPLKPGEDKPAFNFGDEPPFRGKDADLNNSQASAAIRALMQGGMDEDDARKMVLNEQGDLPIPLGYTQEEFEVTANSITNDPETLKKYSNGDPYKAKTSDGTPVTFDEDDVEWVPLEYGVYGLEVDGVMVMLDNGTEFFRIDMEAALSGK